VRRVKLARGEITKAFLSRDGAACGEHGVGVDKRVALNWMYSADEIDFLYKIKSAFDPKNVSNPDKILPVNDDTKLFEQASAAKQGTSSLTPQMHTLIAAVRYRAAEKTKSIITGSGSAMKQMEESDTIKTLSAGILNGTPSLNKDNLTVKTEAGVPMNVLREFLRAEGMELPLPEIPGTVGGAIASKRCPEIEKILLGLEIVAADGTYLNFSSQTLKNVSGYDVCSLFCGSMGAYGIILSAVMRVNVISGGKTRRMKKQNADFKPNEYHIKLKRAMDPENLLNPWIYPGTVK